MKRCPWYFVASATGIKFRFRNCLTTGAYVPSTFDTDVAIHTSDPNAAGKVTGVPVTATVSVPGDGTWSDWVEAGATALGADGKLVLSYTIPDAIDVVYNAQHHHGWTYTGGTDPTVTTAPTAQSIEGHLWVEVRYTIPKSVTRALVNGTSITVGATSGTDAQIRTVGIEEAPWYQIGESEGIAVCFNALQGGKAETYADPVTNPRLWEVPSALSGRAGCRFVYDLGTNDIPDGAAAMESRAEDVITYARSIGAGTVWAQTIMPAVAYVADNADREAYNTWIRALPVALDLDFLADADDRLAYPWDRTILPNYTAPPISWTYDGTHLNPDGCARVAEVWLDTLAPDDTSPSLWDHNEVPVADIGLTKELGIGFDSYTDGVINGVWWYKHASETGAHTVRAWENDGTPLASKAQSGETASGWQYQAFDTPVPYTAFEIIVLSVNINAHCVYNPATYTLPKYRDNLRALYNTQAYTLDGAAVVGGYPGGSYFGAVLGSFPAVLPADGETFFVDVDFTPN